VRTYARIGRVLAAALLAMACFGTGTPSYFTLGSATPESGAPLAAHPELGLAVGPVDLPRYLDRPEIVTRDGSHELRIDDDHRWAGSLRTDIQRVIADDLARLLGTPRVAIYPDQPRFTATYRVLLDVREFEALEGASVQLRVRWTIAAVPDGHALAVDEAVIVQPLPSASYEDVVAAQSGALGTLSHQIAERIASLDSH